ncbi:Hemolysin, contains CBS domains [Pseudidiomarina planktonica]|uniref:Hemolysin, contains CBS domains n=1 Tax=Pseudidiomarina planktonica TaxID=1323738 RepID=A0A1Y6FYK6_9GAMM|nr:CNNM domain-containing protein [Pseudidiomarina planktonica]RUO63863.1 hemolysin [Pseudidiomarina planktonica]SMQ80065.1 Hemolysin, contains CBS domains [Pseudidiomarina planktonica]
MLLLIVFALVAVGVSFICSILEAALLSITPSYVAGLKKDRPALHTKMQNLKAKIDQPLAAILTLNTVAHTAGAAGVGAQVAVVYGDGYLGIASAVMTVLILVLSEIIPKTIGAKFWRTLAPILPATLNFMIWILKPFIVLSDMITKNIGGKEDDIDVRAEIKAMASLGHEQEVMDASERRVISNILDLHERKVRDIMTPRMVCQVVKPETTVAEFVEQLRHQPFSRYPVIDKDEAPHGIIFKSDMLEADPVKSIGELARDVETVMDTVDADSLMMRMLEQRQHMCLVFDEHGSWLGLVTLEDVIETILGQPIMDETDNVSSLRRYAKQRFGQRIKKDN